MLIPSEPGVEVLGFRVVILVDAHLAGVYSCIGFTGAVVGIDVSWGEGFDVNESSLGARGDLIGGVNVLATMLKMMRWSTLSIFFGWTVYWKITAVKLPQGGPWASQEGAVHRTGP